MAFLGTPLQATPIDKRRRFIENWEPTFAAAAEAAFDDTRQLFGLKPLTDLQQLANIKGFSGPTAITDMYSDDPFFESQTPSSRLLEPDEANEKYGIEGALKFTEPVLEDEASFKQRLKNEELQRAFTLERNKGFLNNLGTFGVELIADVTDPIGFASLFFPVTKLRTVAGLTKKFGRATPYVVGGLEAAGSAVIPMTPGYFAAQEFDYSFTPADYGVSLAGAAVLGGALRKIFFQKELKDTQQLLDELDDLNKQGKQDLKNQQQKSDDTVSGSAASKAESDTSPEGRAESRKHSVLDAAYEIKDPARIQSIHDYIRKAEHFKGDIQALETNLGNARSTLIDINKALVEVNDLLKSETNAKVSTRLVDLRKTLEQYKKIGEATVKRLEKEAKTNVVEKALTDKDTEVSPNDAATIEFNLKEINEAGGKIRKAANNDKNAKKRPRNKIGTKLQVLFPEVWKSLNKKTKTRIINEVADKENITVDDIITAFKNHTDSDQLDVAKEKLLKQNEEELSTPAVDYEEDWNDLIIEQQAEAEEAVQRKVTEVEDLQQANADLIDNMKMSTLYTNPETGELIPEFTKIIEDYENGIISPDKLGESLEKVDRCLRGNY